MAIILKRFVAAKSLMEWNPVNNKIIRIRLQVEQINTNFNQCYSPTNDSNKEDKEEFYEQLQAEIENSPRHDIKIIMGDLNAKVGRDNSSYERPPSNLQRI